MPQRRTWYLASIAAVVLAALVTSSTASAATYCVQAPSCVGTNTTLDAALTAAAASAADDTIRIGPVTLSNAGFTYSPGANGGTLAIIGSGSSTILTGGSSGTVLQIAEDSMQHLTTVSHLAVQDPHGASYTFGITASRALIDHVIVTAPGTGGYPIGVFIADGSTLRHSISDVGLAGWAAVEASQGAGAPLQTIDDVRATGTFGVLVESGPARVRRSTITAGREGVEACNTQAIVEDSVLQVVANGTGLASQGDNRCGTDPSAITARQVTIVGDGNGGGSAISMEAGLTAASLDLRHSIVRLLPATIYWQSVTHGATVTVGSSDADLSSGAQTGTPGTLTQFAGNMLADPLFLDAAAGDYRLHSNSPVIDSGPSEPLAAGESAVDRAGNARIRDGNGDGVAKRDMGAYEYQHAKPHASAKANHKRRPAGHAFRFSVKAADLDAGDTLTIRWKFDDGKKAHGASVRHTFRTRGRHTAKVTVTDQTGLRTTKVVRVKVT